MKLLLRFLFICSLYLALVIAYRQGYNKGAQVTFNTCKEQFNAHREKRIKDFNQTKPTIHKVKSHENNQINPRTN